MWAVALNGMLDRPLILAFYSASACPSFATHGSSLFLREACLTPGITRRALNFGTDKLTMIAALFAVGCMPLLGAAL